MYDRLKDSNKSNDERNVKHVQERPQNRKWSEKSNYERNKKRPGYQKLRYKDNRCGQCGTLNWSRQQTCPARTVNSATVKRKDTTKKRADSRRKFNMWIKLHLRPRKTIGITTKYKVSTITRKRRFLSRNFIGQ